MFAVIFEVKPASGRTADYLDEAARLRPILEALPGFISVERFESLTMPGRLLSLSFFENEDAVTAWRQHVSHRQSQKAGRDGIFADYRLRIASVTRDYGIKDRAQAPDDSRTFHDTP